MYRDSSFYRRTSPLVLLLLFGCAESQTSDLEAGEGASARPQRGAEKGATPAPRAAAQGKASTPGKASTAKSPKGDAAAAGEPALTRKPAPAPRGEGEEKGPVRTAAEEVASLLRDLDDPEQGEEAFRKIWEAPRAWIPELIRHVEDRKASRVERIQMLIVDPDFVGDSKQFLANRIHGLGRMEVVEEVEKGDLRVVSQEYTKMSYGLARNKKGYRLVMDKFGGFPVGVVIRAGLINRFRGARSPESGDDDPAPGKLTEWWREYFRRAGPEL